MYCICINFRQMTKKSEVKICDTTIDETQLSTDDSSIDLGSSFEPESPNVFNEFHGRSAPSYTAIKHDVTKPYTSEGSVQKSIKRPKAENKLNFRLKSLKNKENNRMTQSKKVFENKVIVISSFMILQMTKFIVKL